MFFRKISRHILNKYLCLLAIFIFVQQFTMQSKPLAGKPSKWLSNSWSKLHLYAFENSKSARCLNVGKAEVTDSKKYLAHQTVSLRESLHRATSDLSCCFVKDVVTYVTSTNMCISVKFSEHSMLCFSIKNFYMNCRLHCITNRTLTWIS
jgi:hypothetical protein